MKEYSQEQLLLQRENDWPRVVLFLIGMILLAAAILFFQWVRDSSAARILTNRIATFSQPSLIDSIATIKKRTSDETLKGATVLLKDVRVERVVGNYLFTLEGGNGNGIPVLLLGEITGRQAENQTEIRAQQNVRIFGFLLPLNESHLISDPAFISPEDKDLLERQSYYIAAIRVTVLD